MVLSIPGADTGIHKGGGVRFFGNKTFSDIKNKTSGKRKETQEIMYKTQTIGYKTHMIFFL